MLSERQAELLTAIINEFINSSEPVGSELIVRKYKINCSAATIRNEMARLIEDGFLKMLHTSSGRVPTSMAYRYYLEEMMKEEELPVLQEVAMKQRLWPARFELDKLLRQAATSLADVTKELSIITTKDGYATYSGAVNILDSMEFWDIEAAKAALHLLDRNELLENIFEKAPYGGDVRFVIGSELGNPKLEECGIVFSEFSTGSKNGYVAVLGPARMRYETIIPTVRYTKNLIEELAGSW